MWYLGEAAPMNDRSTVALVALVALITGAVATCWLLARPKSAVNYGSALGAAVAARDAVRKYGEATGKTLFGPAGLDKLRDYGLEDTALPMLRMIADTNTIGGERTIVIV